MSVVINALERHARLTPHGRALSGSQECLSWQELISEVNWLATALNGSRVLATLLINAPAWVVADLATLHASVVHVPLPAFFSNAQLQHALQDAGVDTVITDDPARISALIEVSHSDTLWLGGREYSRLHLQPVASQAPPGVAKVTYTSGTTGTPQGVCLSLDAIETVAATLAQASDATANDRPMALLPLSILLENIGTVYVPILCGAEILIPGPAECGMDGSSRVDPVRLAATLQRYRPTALIIPPGLLKLLTGLARHGQVPDSLRFIAVGGAPAGQGLLQEAADCGLNVFQGYGLSEAASVVALNTPAHNRPGSVGRPLPHVQASISETGEILVQGLTFSGYLGDTARDPASLLATGDSGHIDADGFLYVTGRIRERIITTFGRNVSPEWVEAELLAHPQIAQAAIFADDRGWLCAVLVPSTPDATGMENVIAATNAKLPDYAHIDSWQLAATPFSVSSGELTASGSPRRDVIEQHYALPRKASHS